MSWDARDTMSLRTEFVLFASQDGANIRSLCRRFGYLPPAISGFAAGRRRASAFRTARAYRTIPRTAHLTTSQRLRMAHRRMNAGAHAR
jgi:hypothetical protein